MRKVVLTILTITLSARSAAAGIDKAGTTGASFLSLGMGAGPLGMGGATLGMFGDLSSVSWNVGSLGKMSETQFSFSHAPLAGTGAQDAMVFGGKLGMSGMRWALNGLYQGDGAFEGRDALGNSTGSFNASSMAFGATLARSIGPFASVGFGGKIVTEKLGDVSGFGGTFDAGMLVERNGFGFGVAAQNVGGRMKYGDVYYQMPTNLGAGVSFSPPMSGLRIALDYNHPTAYYDDVRGGVEWMWHGKVALRTGYRHEMGGVSTDALNGPTFGIGAGVRGVWMDYGYIASSNGDGEHRISLRMSPRAWSVPGAGILGSSDQEKHSPKLAEAVPPAPKKEKTKKAKPSQEPAAIATHAPALAATTQAAPAPAPLASTTTPKTEPAAKTTAATQTSPPTQSTKSTPVAQTPVPTATTKTTTVAQKPTPTQAKATQSPVAHAPTTKRTPSAGASVAPATSNEPAEPAADKKTTEPAPATVKPTAATPSSAQTTTPAPATSAPTTPIPATVKPAPAPVQNEPAPAAPVKRPDKVRVKSGETMMSIARRYNTSVAAIMMENNLVSDQVKSGQVLKLPAHQ